MSLFKHFFYFLLQRGIHQLQQLHHSAHSDGTDHSKTRAYPLMVQGLRTNPNDPECHILCFDIEALVGKLLSFICSLILQFNF